MYSFGFKRRGSSVFFHALSVAKSRLTFKEYLSDGAGRGLATLVILEVGLASFQPAVLFYTEHSTTSSSPKLNLYYSL